MKSLINAIIVTLMLSSLALAGEGPGPNAETRFLASAPRCKASCSHQKAGFHSLSPAEQHALLKPGK